MTEQIVSTNKTLGKLPIVIDLRDSRGAKAFDYAGLQHKQVLGDIYNKFEPLVDKHNC